MRAGVASIKEPVGVLRADGKRSGGLTLVPWQAWIIAVSDLTVTGIMARTYLTLTSVTAGSAAEIVALCKEGKYSDQSSIISC